MIGIEFKENESACKDFYDTIAPLYDDAILSNETDWIIRKLENKIAGNFIKENNISLNNLVIDVGAGTGYYSNLAANYFDRVVAVDISEEMLRMMKSNGSDIWPVTSDSAHLPFKDSSVDTILCLYGVLNYLHYNARIATIKEIHRVLKDEGTLIFSIWRYTQEHSFKNWIVNNGKYSTFEDKMTDKEINKLLNCAGLDIVISTTVPNISGKLYHKLLKKHVDGAKQVPFRTLLLYMIEKLMFHVPKFNRKGWLFIGIAKKNK